MSTPLPCALAQASVAIAGLGQVPPTQSNTGIVTGWATVLPQCRQVHVPERKSQLAEGGLKPVGDMILAWEECGLLFLPVLGCRYS